MQEKVRTVAIQVRKVRRDVNPADLFTKDLPSKDKIHQLVRLFGCECRAGRSVAAPLLRPQDSGGGVGGQPATGHLPTFVTTDGDIDMQEPHNLDILPHLHDADAMDKLFPVLEAPPAGVNIEDWETAEPMHGAWGDEQEKSIGRCTARGGAARSRKS